MKEKKAAAQTALLEAIATLAPHANADGLKNLAEAYSLAKGGDPLAKPRSGVVH